MRNDGLHINNLTPVGQGLIFIQDIVVVLYSMDGAVQQHRREEFELLLEHVSALSYARNAELFSACFGQWNSS